MLIVHIYLSGMLLKRKKSIQAACRNTAGALTAAEMLQTLQNGSCWCGTHSPEARGSSAGWLQDAAGRGSSLPSPRACSPDWTLGNNILHTRVATQTLKKVKSRFRKSWVILTHTEASSWPIADPTTQKGKSVPLWRAGVHWSLRGFSAVLKSHTQLQIRHPETRDRISPLPTDLLPVLIFSVVYLTTLVLHPSIIFTFLPSTPNTRVLTILMSN